MWNHPITTLTPMRKPPYPTHPNSAQQDERHKFLQMPRLVVVNVEHDQVVVAKRVDGAQDERCDERTEERSPQRLQGEVIADLCGNTSCD